MRIEENPMYALARAGEVEGLSEQELLTLASSRKFLKTIKKKIHYDDIITLFFDDLNGAAEGPPLPNSLSAVALHCALKQRVREDIRGMLSFIKGFTLLDEMRLEESLTLFRNTRSIFSSLGRAELLRMATGMISVASMLLGRNYVTPQSYKSVQHLAETELFVPRISHLGTFGHMQKGKMFMSARANRDLRSL